LRKWAAEALRDGFTHLLASNGKATLLSDIAAGKVSVYKRRGCRWAPNGALPYANLTLWDRDWNNLGHYKLTGNPAHT